MKGRACLSTFSIFISAAESSSHIILPEGIIACASWVLVRSLLSATMARTNPLTKFLHGIGEALTPVLASSKFVEKGVLTPEEFVVAGDLLCARNPSWSW